MQTIQYNSIDKYPINGINYYRLLQIDFDGQYAFSPIRSVDFPKNVFSLFPNPSSGEFNVVNPFEKAQITIFDVTGKRVFFSEIDDTLEQFDLSRMPKGIYIVEISSAKLKAPQIIKLKLD